MTSIKTAALVAALLTAAAPAAFAQSHTAPVSTPPQTITGTIGPNQFRASKFIGMDVYGKYNQQIGSVQDIVLNRNGTVAAVVISGGNNGDVALPLKDFDASNNRLTLTHLSKQQVQGAQLYHLQAKNGNAGNIGVPVRGGQLGIANATGAPGSHTGTPTDHSGSSSNAYNHPGSGK